MRAMPFDTRSLPADIAAAEQQDATRAIAFWLLGVAGMDELLAHPKCGASWEGFMLHEVIRRTGAQRGEAFFWSVHTGAELDLLILRGRPQGRMPVRFVWFSFK
jgi:predicted AAA+ superfamily ATPase